MIRSLPTLFAVLAAFVLAGCASQPAAPVSAAAAAAATANDAALAAKLKGNWTGAWSLPGFGGGKFELIVNEVTGNIIRGNANWYGTATGDSKGSLSKAIVQNGALSAEQPNISFKLSPKGDNTLSGTWSAGAYSGPLDVRR